VSAGFCRCPCSQWAHDGAICTGTADTAMPINRTQDGNTGLPVCRSCRTAILEVDDRGVLVPPGGSL
jgi:hypothetical protein